jgi:hypothetical protein
MNYRRLNIILLAALLALVPILLAVPWFNERAGLFYPKCVLEQLTGRNCPMCGLTTGLRDLLTGIRRGGPPNPLVIPVAVLVLLEITARAVLGICRLPPHALQLAKRWDLRLHAALLIAYLAYCAVFFTR